MIPWFQPTYNFPLSGDIRQKIDPDLYFGSIGPEVGDSEVEKEVFLKVASYGKQIGMITDALLSLVEKLDFKTTDIQALPELLELHRKIEEIKTAKKNRIHENAKRILDKLQRCDLETFNKLLKSYDK